MFVILENCGHDCDCFKCTEKKAIAEFANSLKKISESIGFLPRMYDSKYNYYKPLDEGISSKQIAANKISINLSAKDKVNIVNALESIIQTNKIAKVKYQGIKLIHCRDCGTLHPKKQSVITQEKEHLCKPCFRTRYSVCKHCGIVDYKINLALVATADQVCDICIKAKYERCRTCGVYEEKGNSVLVNTPILSLGDPGTFACRKCSVGFISCAGCGHSFQIGKNNVEMWAKKTVPWKCPSCKMLGHNFIDDHKFKPSPIFWAAPGELLSKDTLMYGIEFEILHVKSTEEGTRTEFAGKIRNHIGRKFAYCKHDGSVKINDQNYGFEIVTQPFSDEYYKLNKRRIDELFTWLKLQGADANNTCGLHVHMSKNSFGFFHLYKFLKFFYDPDNEKFIYFISERTNKEWFNHYCPLRDSDRKYLPKFSKDKKNVSGERHSAISLMMPATVEVRIFEMRMDTALFHKNMEFCKAVFDFSKCKPHTAMTYKEFILFVKDNAKTYPNLWSFISEHGTKFIPKKGSKI